MYVDINYNGNETLKKLDEDEHRAQLLTRLGWLIIAMGAFFYVMLFLVLFTSHVPSNVLTIISAVGFLPLVGTAFGFQQLHHAALLSKTRVSVGYRIAAFQLDRGFDGRPTKSPYRPYVYAPSGMLIGVLYNQSDVQPLIALQLTGKLSAEWLELHCVPEFAAIKAKEDERYELMAAISAHQEQVAREQEGR